MLDLDKIRENTAKGAGMKDAIRLEELRVMAGVNLSPVKYDPFVEVDPEAETREMPVVTKLHSDWPSVKKDT